MGLNISDVGRRVEAPDMGTVQWDSVKANRNVLSVCLASRSTARVSGGLKSS